VGPFAGRQAGHRILQRLGRADLHPENLGAPRIARQDEGEPIALFKAELRARKLSRAPDVPDGRLTVGGSHLGGHVETSGAGGSVGIAL
jgi:hypothetical protein